ncbi:hypothetical protein [Amycolatopsis magusensis]|uniref:hypothetical protein n=1 Tax=Amycolatopsis magusensis TaxID=882444 RepID=UPI0024A86491|nr:hypothetical protein [Amycolatopsis magusensis]MDI5976776.1 hypothetical protein [Amycolatopsis magusensis]
MKTGPGEYQVVVTVVLDVQGSDQDDANIVAVKAVSEALEGAASTEDTLHTSSVEGQARSARLRTVADLDSAVGQGVLTIAAGRPRHLRNPL